MIGVTRTYRYFSVHRLSHPGFTEAGNRARYGKCANPNGHGHEYVIAVTVGAKAPERSDWTVEPAALDRAVRECLDPLFDHQNLETTLGGSLMTSGENISRIVWEHLGPALGPWRLLRVAVRETAKNSFEYFG